MDNQRWRIVHLWFTGRKKWTREEKGKNKDRTRVVFSCQCALLEVGRERKKREYEISVNSRKCSLSGKGTANIMWFAECRNHYQGLIRAVFVCACATLIVVLWTLPKNDGATQQKNGGYQRFLSVYSCFKSRRLFLQSSMQKRGKLLENATNQGKGQKVFSFC